MEQYLRELVAQNKKLIELAQQQAEHLSEIALNIASLERDVGEIQVCIKTQHDLFDVTGPGAALEDIKETLNDVKTAIEDLPDNMKD